MKYITQYSLDPPMPIIYKDRNQEYLWGIWKIEEPQESLLNDLTIDDDLNNSLQTIKVQNRKLESIATRKLLKTLTCEMGIDYKGIWKDEHGKPFLFDNVAHISISHSYPYAAAMVNMHSPTGIDLEHYNEKILRLEAKFMSEQEIFDCKQEVKKMILVWAAKEALYKSYGRKNLSFKNNIEVMPFEMLSTGHLNSQVKRVDDVRFFDLEYLQFPNFIVCYTV